MKLMTMEYMPTFTLRRYPVVKMRPRKRKTRILSRTSNIFSKRYSVVQEIRRQG
jgi:hypothetical protein